MEISKNYVTRNAFVVLKKGLPNMKIISSYSEIIARLKILKLTKGNNNLAVYSFFC